jgi:opacity protein-like surface antigen
MSPAPKRTRRSRSLAASAAAAPCIASLSSATSSPPAALGFAALSDRSSQTPVVPRNIIGSGSSAVSTLSRHTPSVASTKLSLTREDVVRAFNEDDAEIGDGGESDEEYGNDNDDADELKGVLGFETDANLRDVIEEREEINNSVLPESYHQFNSEDAFLTYRDGTPIEDADLPSFIPEENQPHGANPVNGTPAFKDVDNPGDWNSFMFKPKNKTNGKYSHHKLPSGATPVPKTPGYEGHTRKINDWTVNYGGTFHVSVFF